MIRNTDIFSKDSLDKLEYKLIGRMRTVEPQMSVNVNPLT